VAAAGLSSAGQAGSTIRSRPIILVDLGWPLGCVGSVSLAQHSLNRCIYTRTQQVDDARSQNRRASN